MKRGVDLGSLEYIRSNSNSLYKYAKYFLILLILISISYIIAYYNDGADIHDAGVYYDSGWAVLKGQNPHTEIGSRWGSFGPIPFSILLSIFPEVIRAGAVRIMSLAGIFIFFKILFPGKSKLESLTVFFIVIWLSPVRELMVTNQMSGIAVGLSALGVRLMKDFESIKSIKKEYVLGALFWTMALDMKPHICVLFFLSWIIYNKSYSKFLLVILMWVVTHLIIDISQMRILEFDWLTNLMGLNERASKSSLGDSLSFWPILNYYVDASKTLHLLSIFVTLILTAVCFYLAYSGKWQDAMVLSFVIPSFFIYYHYYDAVPLCVLFALILLRVKNQFLASFAVSFILIPKEYTVLRNQVLVIFVVAFLFAWKIVGDKNFKLGRNLFAVIVGLALSIVLHLLNTTLELSEHLLQSLIVTESLIIIISLYLYASIKKISLS